MNLTNLLEATKLAEHTVENYYAGTSTYQGSKLVAVLGNYAVIINNGDYSKIKEANKEGFIFDVKYKNKIAVDELRIDLSEKE